MNRAMLASVEIVNAKIRDVPANCVKNDFSLWRKAAQNLALLWR